MEALSAVYGAAASWRRQWYARRPSSTRSLTQPVISIGNLRVGGTGKTPTTAAVARLLVEQGEHPVILSRGYARQQSAAGVTIVSDRTGILTDVAHAGDEPMLLAQRLPGVPVLVCADRHRAGREAERRFDVTVHLLDDGFQHVRLRRDLDLLLVDEADLDDRVLPAGRLREPIANASAADAVIVPGGSLERARLVGNRLGIVESFALSRRLGEPKSLGGEPLRPTDGGPVLAVAGIARPERFFDDLRAAGYTLAGTMAFADHHVYRQHDVDAVAIRARDAGATAVLTTEKDAVRLTALDRAAARWAMVPLSVSIEPGDVFATWLTMRLHEARARAGRLSR